MRVWEWFKEVFGIERAVPNGEVTETMKTRYFTVKYPQGMKEKYIKRLDILFERFIHATRMAAYGHTMVKYEGVEINLVGRGWLNLNFGNPLGHYDMYGMTVPSSDGPIRIYLCDLSDDYVYHELAHFFIIRIASGRFGVSPELHEAWAVAMAKLAKSGGPPSPTIESIRSSGAVLNAQLGRMKRKAGLEQEDEEKV